MGVNTWVAHRSKAFEPDPDVFRPKRWLEAGKEQLVKMNASHIVANDCREGSGHTIDRDPV